MLHKLKLARHISFSTQKYRPLIHLINYCLRKMQTFVTAIAHFFLHQEIYEERTHTQSNKTHKPSLIQIGEINLGNRSVSTSNYFGQLCYSSCSQNLITERAVLCSKKDMEDMTFFCPFLCFHWEKKTKQHKQSTLEVQINTSLHKSYQCNVKLAFSVFMCSILPLIRFWQSQRRPFVLSAYIELWLFMKHRFQKALQSSQIIISQT